MQSLPLSTLHSPDAQSPATARPTRPLTRCLTRVRLLLRQAVLY
jgi:hypothetical protein